METACWGLAGGTWRIQPLKRPMTGSDHRRIRAAALPPSSHDAGSFAINAQTDPGRCAWQSLLLRYRIVHLHCGFNEKLDT